MTRVVIDVAGKNKDYVSTVIKLRADIAARLDTYKSETGVPKTFVIEKAVEKYLDEVAPVTGDKKDD